MPTKKKHHINYLKSSQAAAATSSSATSRANKDRPTKSVNELLANLRVTSPASNPRDPLPPPANTPSVPPVVRHVLQIPEAPAPRPRYPVRQRFDNRGRRLPPGPPPPPSWTTHVGNDSAHARRIGAVNCDVLAAITLPGQYLPAPSSLVDVVLRRIASEWDILRVYDWYNLYYIPSHLKAALMRQVSIANGAGITLADLKALLIVPEYEDESERSPGQDATADMEVNTLDLTGSIGKSLRLKDVVDLLFPAGSPPASEELQDSWDTAADASPNITRALLPNLTHLSLALNPQHAHNVSWRYLLAVADRFAAVTHLSLAYWPEPCLTPNATLSTVASPQGRAIPYGGTNYYSHSIDHDWSEALLVLRLLSKSFYELEYLDLTGCAPWFKALTLRDGHDFVDWAGAWGKMTQLRLNIGWTPGEDAMPSDKMAFDDARQMAAAVERHIIAMRNGRGRFITVQRPPLNE